MKLEVGKRYMTRYGEVTEPLKKNPSTVYPFMARVDGAPEEWTENGDYISGGTWHEMDLVREYDKSVVTTEHAYAALPTLPSTETVLQSVAKERVRQDSKWGQQNHGPADWLAILTEETGEVARAVCEMKVARDALDRDEYEGHKANYREELIQVAAVAVAMVECLDRNNKGE